MNKNNRNNEQIYGRNDMIMLDQNNKIYGSLGLADNYVMKTEEGTRLVLNNPKSGRFGDVLTEFNMYVRSEQKQYKGINLLPPNTKQGEFVEVSIPKGSFVFYITDETVASGGNFRFFNEDKTENMWFGVDAGSTSRIETLNFDAKYVQNLIKQDFDLSKICLGIGNEPIYEPYVGGQPSPSPDYPQEIKSVVNPIINVCGKNLLKYPYVEANKTSQGIMFTDNKDGSINVSGTATDTAYYNLYLNMDGKRLTLTSGTYKLVAKGRSKCNIFVNNGVTSAQNEGTFTITDGHNDVWCFIQVFKGLAVDETIYPMIQLASITDESYEPYQEEQTVALPYTLNAIPVSSGGNYTDQSGQQWICDEVDLHRGVKVQRIYNIDVDGENVKFEQAGGYANIIPRGLPIALYNVGQKIFAISTFTSLSWYYNKVNGQFLYLVAADIADKINESCKKQLGKIHYVLATPIETPLTPAEIAAFNALTTYHPATIVENNYNTWMKATYKSIESV